MILFSNTHTKKSFIRARPRGYARYVQFLPRTVCQGVSSSHFNTSASLCALIWLSILVLSERWAICPEEQRDGAHETCKGIGCRNKPFSLAHPQHLQISSFGCPVACFGIPRESVSPAPLCVSRCPRLAADSHTNEFLHQVGVARVYPLQDVSLPRFSSCDTESVIPFASVI